MKSLILSLIFYSFIQAQGFTTLGLLMDDATFTPTDVASATILGWYDFSDASKVFTTSTRIDSVQDKSGTQEAGIGNSEAGQRPDLAAGQNSLNVSDFTAGSFDKLFDAGFSGFTAATDGFSVFAVIKFDDVTNGCAPFEASDNTSINRGFLLYAFSSALAFRPDGANEATAAFTNTSTYVIFSGVNTPSSRTYYINGESQNTNSSTQNMAAAPTRLMIGALADGSSFAFDGKIGEVIIYKGAISAAERVKIEKYLNDKWAVY